MKLRLAIWLFCLRVAISNIPATKDSNVEDTIEVSEPPLAPDVEKPVQKVANQAPVTKRLFTIDYKLKIVDEAKKSSNRNVARFESH